MTMAVAANAVRRNGLIRIFAAIKKNLVPKF